MACNCIGGNPCPCMRMGSITFGPLPSGPSAELAGLLEKARLRVMTPKEVYEQRVSWILGMLPFDSKTTEADVRRHLAEMGVVEPESARAEEPR